MFLVLGILMMGIGFSLGDGGRDGVTARWTFGGLLMGSHGTVDLGGFLRVGVVNNEELGDKSRIMLGKL